MRRRVRHATFPSRPGQRQPLPTLEFGILHTESAMIRRKQDLT
jgi:hypothetical protein